MADVDEEQTPTQSEKSFPTTLEAEFKKRLAQAIVGIAFAAVAAIGALAWAYIRALPERFQIPKNTIVAIDDKDGCPKGWLDIGYDENEYVRFAGRVLVVAGPAVRNEQRNELINAGTVERTPDAEGGQESVRLESIQIPAHSHSISELKRSSEEAHPDGFAIGSYFVNRVWVGGNPIGKKLSTSNAGGTPGGETLPHENMPPFIAMHFCKKTT